MRIHTAGKINMHGIQYALEANTHAEEHKTGRLHFSSAVVQLYSKQVCQPEIGTHTHTHTHAKTLIKGTCTAIGQ